MLTKYLLVVQFNKLGLCENFGLRKSIGERCVHKR